MSSRYARGSGGGGGGGGPMSGTASPGLPRSRNASYANLTTLGEQAQAQGVMEPGPGSGPMPSARSTSSVHRYPAQEQMAAAMGLAQAQAAAMQAAQQAQQAVHAQQAAVQAQQALQAAQQAQVAAQAAAAQAGSYYFPPPPSPVPTAPAPPSGPGSQHGYVAAAPYHPHPHPHPHNPPPPQPFPDAAQQAQAAAALAAAQQAGAPGRASPPPPPSGNGTAGGGPASAGSNAAAASAAASAAMGSRGGSLWAHAQAHAYLAAGGGGGGGSAMSPSASAGSLLMAGPGSLCASLPRWVRHPPVEAVVFGWGVSEDGQLGFDTITDVPSPKVVEALLGVQFSGRGFCRTPLVAGSRNTLAIDAAGQVWSLGWNDRGTLGLGHRSVQRKPQRVAALKGIRVVQVAMGGWHCLALSDRGTMFAWGGNEYGQCGTDEGLGLAPGQRDITEPLPVDLGLGPSQRVRQVAAGGMHSLALLEDGTVWQWGENWGDFSMNPLRIPRPVPGAVGVAAVACGAFHNLLLTAGGRVLSWGMNDYGQLGNGSTTYATAPRPVLDMDSVVVADIAAGGWHSAALSSAGEVWVWGRGEYGRLGLGDRSGSSKLRPQKVRGLESHVVVQVAAGGSHTMALTSTARLFVWGRGAYGRLGMAGGGGGGELLADCYHPVECCLPGGVERWRVAAIAAGGRHSMVLAIPVRDPSHLSSAGGFGVLEGGGASGQLGPGLGGGSSGGGEGEEYDMDGYSEPSLYDKDFTYDPTLPPEALSPGVRSELVGLGLGLGLGLGGPPAALGPMAAAAAADPAGGAAADGSAGAGSAAAAIAAAGGGAAERGAESAGAAGGVGAGAEAVPDFRPMESPPDRWSSLPPGAGPGGVTPAELEAALARRGQGGAGEARADYASDSPSPAHSLGGAPPLPAPAAPGPAPTVPPSAPAPGPSAAPPEAVLAPPPMVLAAVSSVDGHPGAGPSGPDSPGRNPPSGPGGPHGAHAYGAYHSALPILPLLPTGVTSPLSYPPPIPHNHFNHHHNHHNHPHGLATSAPAGGAMAALSAALPSPAAAVAAALDVDSDLAAPRGYGTAAALAAAVSAASLGSRPGSAHGSVTGGEGGGLGGGGLGGPGSVSARSGFKPVFCGGGEEEDEAIQAAEAAEAAAEQAAEGASEGEGEEGEMEMEGEADETDEEQGPYDGTVQHPRSPALRPRSPGLGVGVGGGVGGSVGTGTQPLSPRRPPSFATGGRSSPPALGAAGGGGAGGGYSGSPASRGLLAAYGSPRLLSSMRDPGGPAGQ